jgi:hypothetical protein
MKFSSHLEKATEGIFQEKRKLLYKIIFDWGKIVGEAHKDKVIPIDIVHPKSSQRQGTIVLLCKNPSFGTEVQMMAPVITERLNTYFGYKAIDKVKIKS